jgi:thymidylate kinase
VSSVAARSGCFLVIVGPDGVGKTTMAGALIELYDGPTVYFHFRPPLQPPIAAVPLAQTPPPPRKKREPGWRALGWARLAYNLLRFWVGYLRTVRPALRRGALVVGDRYAYGYLVQPRALRFYGPEGLARAVLRWLPRPDLVVNLTAPAEIIHGRKQELTLLEIEAELRAWRALTAAPLLTVDGTRCPAMAARSILEAAERG